MSQLLYDITLNPYLISTSPHWECETIQQHPIQDSSYPREPKQCQICSIMVPRVRCWQRELDQVKDKAILSLVCVCVCVCGGKYNLRFKQCSTIEVIRVISASKSHRWVNKLKWPVTTNWLIYSSFFLLTQFGLINWVDGSDTLIRVILSFGICCTKDNCPST